MPSVTKQSSTQKKPLPSSNGQEDDLWGASQYINMMLWGASGTGKTTVWSTFPKPILALLSSGIDNPGELISIDTPENRKNIKPVKITSTDQFRKELEKAGNFATVVQDHGTSLQDIILKEIMGWDDVKAQRPIIGGNKAVWGKVGEISKELYRDLMNCKSHSIMVAQDRIFTAGGDEEGSSDDVIKPKMGAAFTPAVTGWLNFVCDYVVQTFIRPKYIDKIVNVNNKQKTVKVRGKGVEYCLRIEPTEVIQAKFRKLKSKEIPEIIVDPTYEKIEKLIRG